MADELIWHVDENDKPIGSISRDESRRIGARYRMVRIMVESDDGSAILLQKRLKTKKTYPGCWDTSAGGNIAYKESYDQAARRELLEEIGLENTRLEEVLHFYSEMVDPDGNKMNRFTKVYRATAGKDFLFTPQPSEVESVEWINREELPALVAKGNITDGLLQVYERWYQQNEDN
jgi:isopentenyldiphosphate isomerase